MKKFSHELSRCACDSSSSSTLSSCCFSFLHSSNLISENSMSWAFIFNYEFGFCLIWESSTESTSKVHENSRQKRFNEFHLLCKCCRFFIILYTTTLMDWGLRMEMKTIRCSRLAFWVVNDEILCIKVLMNETTPRLVMNDEKF